MSICLDASAASSSGDMPTQRLGVGTICVASGLGEGTFCCAKAVFFLQHVSAIPQLQMCGRYKPIELHHSFFPFQRTSLAPQPLPSLAPTLSRPALTHDCGDYGSYHEAMQQVVALGAGGPTYLSDHFGHQQRAQWILGRSGIAVVKNQKSSTPQ